MDGKTITERARARGIAEATARKYAKELEISPERRRGPISDEDWARIEALVVERREIK